MKNDCQLSYKAELRFDCLLLVFIEVDRLCVTIRGTQSQLKYRVFMVMVRSLL